MMASKPFAYLPMGSSSLSLPFSTSVTSAAAVNIFVIEPTRNNISGVTGAPVSMFDTPKPLAKISLSPFTMPTAAPGVFVSLSSAMIDSSNLLKSICVWLAVFSWPETTGETNSNNKANNEMIRRCCFIILPINRKTHFETLGLPAPLRWGPREGEPTAQSFPKRGPRNPSIAKGPKMIERSDIKFIGGNGRGRSDAFAQLVARQDFQTVPGAEDDDRAGFTGGIDPSVRRNRRGDVLADHSK